jgi:MoxR-like ATPase
LTTLLSDGHLLLEDVPGTGKTMLARAMANTVQGTQNRIQFTPDLLPSAVTGVPIYDQRSGNCEFHKGPIFATIVLADEINRASPKTQSALLEVMEEGNVTVDGHRYSVGEPFMVIATQNPVEYEGTYTLPEAQLDRFLLKLVLDLPAREDEVEVMQRHADGFNPRDLAAAGVTATVTADDITAARAAVADVRASAELLGYIVDLARATRQSPSVKLGVSPRGATALLAAAKAWAWLQEAEAITPDHVQSMLLPVWRHRIALRPEAELEGVSADTILRSIVQQVQVPL